MQASAREAGYTESVSRIASTRLEPKAELSIRQALTEAGVTNPYLSNVIANGLTAEIAPGIPNHAERRQFTRLALEAKGELKTGSTVAVQVILPTVSADPTAWGEE